MAKGHKGKSPMVKERTRKLSNIEKAMIEDKMCVLTSNNHLKEVGDVSERVLSMVEEHSKRELKIIQIKDALLKERQKAKRIKLKKLKDKKAALKKVA